VATSESGSSERNRILALIALFRLSKAPIVAYLIALRRKDRFGRGAR